MRRSDVIDWLKATGISLIVYGHVAHASTVPWTPPIYVKQLGVAFFLFATGFTLARERRDPVEVLFNRLFPVYLFGLATALAITAWGLMFHSGLALSNYLPFLGGANVVLNNFPANPTTWYLGTYLHLLVLWALVLRRVRLSRATVLMLLVLEIPVRAALITWAGPYVAYMLLTNWMAVFVAGLVVGGRPASEPDDSAVPYAVALVGGLVVWSIAVEPLGFRPTFPFMSIGQWPPMLGTVAVSTAVSFLYFASTLTAFAAMRRVEAPAPVRFIARHSLIIFLVHMPVFLALNPVLGALHMTTAEKVAVQLLVCLPGLAALSAVVLGVVRPKDLRERLFTALNRGRRLAGGPVPVLGATMNPSVDVIVPCFNYGQLLGACVASVLSQEGVEVRVLVMDDASTDDTEAVGRWLADADPRVQFRRHAVNQGHIATYNEALALVVADYVMILSADDLLTPGALARATGLMEAHPEVGLTYGRDITFHDAPPLGALPASSGRARIMSYLEFLSAACRLGHTGIQAPTALVRTSTHRAIGGYLPALPHSGDTEIWLRMAAHSAVGELDADQAFRRLHTANMSLGYSPLRRLAEQKRAFDTHFEIRSPLTPELAALQRVVHRTIAESAFWNGAQAFERGDAAACEEFLAFAAATSPGLESWDAWRRLNWKRRLGTSAYRVIGPLAAGARRFTRPFSAARPVH